MTVRLSELGENGFIRQLMKRAPRATGPLYAGIGDDTAVIRSSNGYMLFSTDMVVEGVHFSWSTSSWEDAGWKAVAACGSDMAAMGGTAKWICLSLGVPASTDIRLLRQLYRGAQSAAKRLGAAIVGGDTVRSPRVVVDVAMVGEMKHAPKLRSRARVGDVVMVSGTLGEAGMGWRLLRQGKKSPLSAIRRARRPVVRAKLGKWLGAHRAVGAMMDVSDGLAMDVARLCAASRVGVSLEGTRLPIVASVRQYAPKFGWRPEFLALQGGEDYELLWTCRPQAVVGIMRGARRLGVPVSVIGAIVPHSKGLTWIDHGRRTPLHSSGFKHF